MIDFKLPSLGADMDEGKLLEWKVEPGQPVKRGQVVAVVDTTKAAVEVECWQEGTMHEQLVPVGETVPVGTVIATLLAPGESAPAPGARATAPVIEKVAPATAIAKAALPPRAPAAAPATPSAPAATRKAVSPAARRRAGELGIDPDSLVGTGAQGAVTLEDVERAAKAPAPAAPARRPDIRQAIAAAMSRSKREIPHYYLVETIPMRKTLEWLAAENAKRPVTERILVGVLQMKAVALALAKAPELNGFWKDGDFVPGGGVHVGVAISLRQGGLIAPCIHDVDKKDLATLMGELTMLVSRARAGSLRSSEMSDPTITVTNLGDQGTEAVHGVIYPPQVALVGFGRIETRPWVEDGAVHAAPLVTASLAADHRASDGMRGARFMAALRERLQHPEEL